jgi:hypothetical protein
MKFSDLAKLCGDDVTLLLLGAEHECADKAAACIKQELHVAISKRHGIGAPNTTSTTVAAARERVRIPAPKREAAPMFVPSEAHVLDALRCEPATAATVADRIGSKLPVDMGELGKVLARLIDFGQCVATGERRGKRYAVAPPSGPSVDCAASEGE